MKPNDKSAGKDQPAEKDPKKAEKVVVPKGKHAFECGGIFLIFSHLPFFYSKKGTTFVVDDKYEYIKQIGHGAYGVVCSALNKENQNKVAIKKVPIVFLLKFPNPFSRRCPTPLTT